MTPSMQCYDNCQVPDTEISRAVSRQQICPQKSVYKLNLMYSFDRLCCAVSSASGENVPADTEVSPELIDALAKEEVAAEDLEIVQDDEGKSLIRSKSQVSMAMGGVKEGHIYVPVAKSKLDVVPETS